MSTITKIIRNCDMFGKNVNLTYKKDEVYKTIGGGIMTAFVYWFMIGLAINLMIAIFEHESFSTTKNSLQRNLAENPNKFMVDITFGISWADFRGELLDSSYGTITATKVTKTKTESVPEFKNEIITIRDWNETEKQDILFNSEKYPAMRWIDIPKNTEIYGNSFSTEQSYITVTLEPCSGAGCKPSNVLLQEIMKSNFLFGISNKYFDFKNIEAPVTSYVDDRINGLFDPYMEKTINLYLRQNTYTLKDSIFFDYQTGAGKF